MFMQRKRKDRSYFGRYTIMIPHIASDKKIIVYEMTS